MPTQGGATPLSCSGLCLLLGRANKHDIKALGRPQSQFDDRQPSVWVPSFDREEGGFGTRPWVLFC